MDVQHGKLAPAERAPGQFATLADNGLPDLRYDGRRSSGIFVIFPNAANETQAENARTATKPMRYEGVIANWNRYRTKDARADAR